MKAVSFFLFKFTLAFGLGAYAWSFTTDGSEYKLDLNIYLHNAILDILPVTEYNRENYIMNSQIFHKASIVDSRSGKNKSFFHFFPSNDGARDLGIDVESKGYDLKGGRNFDGFYIILNNDGGLTEFGFFKP